MRNAEAYLCGSVPVQNPLLEPLELLRGYAARAAQPGGPENELSRRSQAGGLREEAFRPAWYANHRPWRKHRGPESRVLPPRETRLRAADHGGDACRRLEKKVRSHTGEILRRPTVGKSR